MFQWKVDQVPRFRAGPFTPPTVLAEELQNASNLQRPVVWRIWCFSQVLQGLICILLGCYRAQLEGCLLANWGPVSGELGVPWVGRQGFSNSLWQLARVHGAIWRPSIYFEATWFQGKLTILWNSGFHEHVPISSGFPHPRFRGFEVSYSFLHIGYYSL